MGCPTISVAVPRRPPPVGTWQTAGVDPAIASRVHSYVGPRAGYATNPHALEPDVVLGPIGWACRVYRANGGGAVMYVFPPDAQAAFGSSDTSWTTSASYGGPEVRVETAVLGHLPDASLASAVFATDPIVAQWAASPDFVGTCALPAGRHVTQLTAGVYSFVDPDGTRGVGVMRVRATTPQLDGDYGIVTCKLSGPDASLCDAVVANYWARHPASILGAPSSPSVGPGGVVDTGGHVGTLQFAHSSEADVRVTVGVPDGAATGSFLVPDLPGYRALGYDCTAAATPTRIPLVVQPEIRGPYCATVYFINETTGTLAAFETTSPQYATQHGTAVGMTPTEAQQREGTQLIPHGCQGSFVRLGDFYQDGSAATAAALFVYVGPSSTDRVRAIKAESNVGPVGMLFC